MFLPRITKFHMLQLRPASERKTLTIPWLELMAAMITTRLTNFVLTAILAHNKPIFMWLDSQIVLHWLKSQKPLLTFVHHHITVMNSLIPNTTWKYNNPADLLSRCTTTEAFDVLITMTAWTQVAHHMTSMAIIPTTSFTT